MILCRASKKMLQLFNWIYFTLMWLYTYNQRRSSTIYCNIFPSIVILCISSNKLLHYLFEYIYFFYDYIQSIKEIIAPFIWIHFILPLLFQSIKEGVSPYIWLYLPLPRFYTEHQRRCCTIYLKLFYWDNINSTVRVNPTKREIQQGQLQRHFLGWVYYRYS